MTRDIVIPPDTAVGMAMMSAAQTRRMIFFAGLPGVGKSLFLQQQTLMAANAGRQVHLLQWDLARAAFESGEMLAKYPEIDGFTHPLIRRAVGQWARRAVRQWDEEYADRTHLLIGEVPIVGNRFVELAQNQEDPAEALLNGEGTIFFVPVPSSGVRARIEEMRQASIANPKHANESRDAPINVLQQIWREAREAAALLGLAADSATDYDPETYARLFDHMLQHRNRRILAIDALYPAVGSVYELGAATSEIAAKPADAATIVAELEAFNDLVAISQSVEAWYDI
ncbi:MAG: hypothetical protein QF384_13605 [Alphaproteobacteria bacterium]|jgi:hypothetical protein|nr:hypothetical protein [Alphaproteobacteria bacterium]MDP6832034.1 hypothetical protein [Alphaproteobacteria bacterium]